MTPELIKLIDQQGFILGLSAQSLAYSGLALFGLALLLLIHSTIKKIERPFAIGIPLILAVCLLGMAFGAACNASQAESLKTALNDPNFQITEVQLQGDKITSLSIFGPGQVKEITVLGKTEHVTTNKSWATTSNPKILALLLKDQRIAYQTHQNL